MPVKDRTNIKYGKLTALEYKGQSKWLCQCDCGKQVIVYGGHLESGHTISCGCFRKPRTNLVGQTFGYLTVIEWIGQGKWKCQCKCGNIVNVQTDNLKSGNTKSCGCYQKEQASKACLKNLIGNKFGKLTVIERAPNNRFNNTCWKCRCDCGGITIVDVNNLKNGNTTSCGCVKSKGEETINLWLQNHNINFIPQYSFNDCILDSHRRPYFDFAIFDNNNNLQFLIEYNGSQHYFYTNQGWNNKENFELTQHRDKQKQEYCEQNNIKLKIIKYNENIEEKLKEFFENAETSGALDNASDDILSEM